MNIMKKLNCLITALALAVAISPSAKSEEKGHGHESHAGHMLEGYLKVADALYKDDLSAAKKAAESMADHDEDSVMAKPATEIVKAENITGARMAFKKLSAEAVKMAEMHKKGDYVVMMCPMVKGGDGVWLSADKAVNNPYFGAQMPHCGGPKQ